MISQKKDKRICLNFTPLERIRYNSFNLPDLIRLNGLEYSLHYDDRHRLAFIKREKEPEILDDAIDPSSTAASLTSSANSTYVSLVEYHYDDPDNPFHATTMIIKSPESIETTIQQDHFQFERDLRGQLSKVNVQPTKTTNDMHESQWRYIYGYNFFNFSLLGVSVRKNTTEKKSLLQYDIFNRLMAKDTTIYIDNKKDQTYRDFFFNYEGWTDRITGGRIYYGDREIAFTANY